jgi:hypothetical protein
MTEFFGIAGQKMMIIGKFSSPVIKKIQTVPVLFRPGSEKFAP